MDAERRQYELEREATAFGIDNYYKERMPWHTDGRKASQESDLPPGMVLIKRVVPHLAAIISEWIDAALHGKARPSAPLARVLNQLEPEAIAFITAKIVVNGFSSEGFTIQKLSTEISKWLIYEINLKLFKEQCPGYHHVLTKSLEERGSNPAWSARVMRDAFDKADLDKVEVPLNKRMALGSYLVTMLCDERIGMCEFEDQRDYTRPPGPASFVRVVVPTQATREWLSKQHDRYAFSHPMLLPMICKPLAWSNSRNGGYLTPGFAEAVLVKNVGHEFLTELDEHEMPEVYAAVNAIQETPWQINRAVLSAMEELWKGGSVRAGMPPRDDDLMPAKPPVLEDPIAAGSEAHEAALKEWKPKARKVHERNAMVRPSRFQWLQRMWLARKFQEEEAIYFPHNLDWRGRCYPIPVLLNPQSDDASKSLLRYAKGKALGETGGFWLAVHLANNWAEDSGNGVKTDKLGLEERVQWVQDNSEWICMCANAPADFLKWTNADKPWQFLAAAIEWDGFCREGESFLSHLPVALDGSCSGLQHFSAMIRDADGGRLVNLVPADRPEDIYTCVAARAQSIVESETHKEDLAQAWDGKIGRSVAKRPTMTTCYGVTDQGIYSQTLELIQKEERKGNNVLGLPEEELPKACRYMSKVLKRAIDESMVSASQVMAWLQDMANTIAKDGLPVKWETPVGFPVLQCYWKMKTKKVDTSIGSVRIQVKYYMDDIGKLDPRGQRNGIAPNFVHSLDATHMLMTANRCVDNGIENFAMVHDSFGVHAADCDHLAAIVRETFIDLYRDDVLNDFRDQVVSGLSDELAAKVGPVPPRGDLDLAQVRDSDFFFA